MKSLVHVPVLLKEVVQLLVTRKSGTYLDCTLGLGGHAQAILEVLGPEGKLIGIDRDKQAVEFTRERLKGFQKAVFYQLNFSQLDQLVELTGIEKFTGILFDLGLGKWQIDQAERGFSYLSDGPLDMRMDQSQRLSAYEVVNSYSQEGLARIFKEYGEEKLGKKIAKMIKQAKKKIETTGQLRQIIEETLCSGQKIKTLSRIFQAIRMEVNQELDELKAGLDLALQAAEVKGRVGIISYHSLEDRLVKQTFRELGRRCVCPPGSPVCVCGAKAKGKILTPQPVRPTAEEMEANPGSRSAKLRVIEKLED